MLYIQRIFVALVTLFPAVFFVVPKGAGTIFYLLVLWALVGVGVRLKPVGKPFSHFLRDFWPLHLAMAAMVIATLGNQLSVAHFALNGYELPLQLACFPLLSWILLLVSPKKLQNIQWGLIVGGIVCAVAVYVGTVYGAIRPDLVLGVPVIPFGNIMLLMGVLSLISLGWNQPNEKVMVVLKVVTGCAVLYAYYLTLTRGGWLALPVFAASALPVFRNLSRRSKAAFLFLVIASLLATYAFSERIQERVAEADANIEQYVDGTNKDTSVGLRLQIWRASWLLFKENPVFGVGREGFHEQAQQLAARHIISVPAAGQPHAHNDVLFHLATLGIFGALAILSLHLVPAFYFFRALDSPDRELRTTAGMGMTLSLGFFVFGLTDAMFFWRVSYTFYTVTLAVLFVCMEKQKALLDGAPSVHDCRN